MKLRHILLCIALSATASIAQARGGGGKRRPPQEAIDACQSLSEGESCSFQGRREDTLTGTCEKKDDDKPLACRPERRR